MYKIQRTKQAKKDVSICKSAGFKAQLDKIIDTVKNDPYDPSQKFERLRGNLKGLCSRQINHKNRFLYKVLPNAANAVDEHGNLYDGIVYVVRAWGHNYTKPDLKQHPPPTAPT
jgi:Txe/YoeB family toxin of toxin-antitoxin system